jgi:hypothetical protein
MVHPPVPTRIHHPSVDNVANSILPQDGFLFSPQEIAHPWFTGYDWVVQACGAGLLAFVVQIYSQSPCSAVFRGRAQACELVVRDVVDLLFVAVVEPARSGVSIVVAVGEVCSGDDQYVVLY